MSRRLRPVRGVIGAVAPGFGWCRASNLITRGYELVGWMFREEPTDDDDSGWRFFAHVEPSLYESNPANHARHDVNLIANLDPNIVPLLHAPVGTTYRWSPQADAYIESEEWS